MNQNAVLFSFVFAFVSVCGTFIFAYAEPPHAAISLQYIDQGTVSKVHPETKVGCNPNIGPCLTLEAKPLASTSKL